MLFCRESLVYVIIIKIADSQRVLVSRWQYYYVPKTYLVSQKDIGQLAVFEGMNFGRKEYRSIPRHEKQSGGEVPL